MTGLASTEAQGFGGIAVSGPAVDMAPLFAPRTLAVVGAHDHKPPQDFLTRQLEGRARASGGQFLPVNPRLESVLGHPVLDSVAELPDELDVVSILISDVLTVMRELQGKRVKFVVVYASGFAELGTEAGIAAEREVRELAHALGARMIGPNTNMNLFEVLQPSDLPKMAIVTQSGHQGRPMASAQALGFGVSYWVTTGNEADLGVADFIDYFAAQDNTGAIASYVEGFRTGEGLRRAAAACIDAQTPLVIVKVGRSAKGAAAALSHTGQLAGADEVLDAFFEQTSIHRVTDLDELQEVAHALARCGPLPAADGVAICSASGGCNAHLVDLLGASGLSVPDLSEKTQQRIRELVGPNLSIGNPVDNGGASLLRGIGPELVDAVLDDPAVGVLLLPVSTPLPAMQRPITDLALHAFRRGDKPVIALSLMPSTEDPVFKELVAAGMPVVRNMRNGVSAAKAILSHPARRFPVGAPPGLRAAAQPVPASGPCQVLDEAASLRWLADRGLEPVQHEFVSEAGGVAAAAARVGYPLVLKAVSPQLAHKSEHGAVLVDIRSEAELEGALSALESSLDGIALSGYLVERLEGSGAELLLGISTDPLLGPVIVVGAGGVNAEALQDTGTLVVPFSRDRAEEVVRLLRIDRQLGPWRGLAVRREALIDAVMLMQELALNGEVAELDINPLLLTAERAIVLDGLVVLR